MIWLSVTMRTARLSTSGGLEANACACAVRELLARVPISAVTKPAPPEQSKPRLEIGEPFQLQLHVPNPQVRKMYCIGWLELSGIGLLRTPLFDAGPGRGNERDGTHDNEPEARARMSAFG